MSDNSGENRFDQWREVLEETWRGIPKAFRSDRAVQATLVCRLYRLLEDEGYRVVAGYMPPRIQDRAVDVIAFDGDGRIVHAVCIEPTVTLHAVKSLTSFDSDGKLVVTTGALEKKVQESRFFLKDDVEHVHLKPFS
jgi:hypothetical protein